jgi:hypothetical protein
LFLVKQSGTFIENELHLLYIYDKSKLSNITEKELDELIVKQIKE